MAQIFAALGDGTRLALLSRLCDGHPRSIVQLTQGTGLTRQGVSKHLAILKDACVVSSTRVGRQSLYVIRPDALQEARLYLERASHQWDEAVQRLKHLVED